MSRSHRILIPVDFSDSSRDAFELGARIGRQHGVAIDVLHVGEIPPYFTTEIMSSIVAGSHASLQEWISEGCEKEMQMFVENSSMANSVTLKQHVIVGDIVDVILHFASTRDHDMIVMGTHGRTGLKRIAFGSVATKVVQRATCPVLTVRLGGSMPSWLD